MVPRARSLPAILAIACLGALAPPAFAQPPGEAAIERARKLLLERNPKQAYSELVPLQGSLAGLPEYDYLLGVAALDSSRYDDAIIAFERVLALNPAHAGAQMDLGRAYFALGAHDLAEAAFRKLREQNPPPAAQQAITQYLEAIQKRRKDSRPGWSGFAEAALGYDTNLTGVPADFGAASLQAFNIAVDPTGNSIKRKAGYFEAQASLEYSYPLSRGWSLFAGGGARSRTYQRESDFNVLAGDVRFGGALNDGPTQWRIATAYQDYRQDGAAPGVPRPKNDRETANASLDWRRAIDTRNQVGLSLQASRVRFPSNLIDAFDQVYAGASWLRSFEGRGVPLLYLTLFGTVDAAKNTFADGITDKSKRLAGLRGYFQYSLTPKLQAFTAAGFVQRSDQDDFARSTTVAQGRDRYAELTLGVTWQFQEKCAVRTQWGFTRNASNIDIYDFNRHEVSTAVRCDLF